MCVYVCVCVCVAVCLRVSVTVCVCVYVCVSVFQGKGCERNEHVILLSKGQETIVKASYI